MTCKNWGKQDSLQQFGGVEGSVVRRKLQYFSQKFQVLRKKYLLHAVRWMIVNHLEHKKVLESKEHVHMWHRIKVFLIIKHEIRQIKMTLSFFLFESSGRILLNMQSKCCNDAIKLCSVSFTANLKVLNEESESKEGRGRDKTPESTEIIKAKDILAPQRKTSSFT